MKQFKKLAGIVLALVMVMALAVPSLAASAQAGSITVENATVGETYSIYKIFDAEYRGGDNSREAIYTIKDTDKWYNLVNTDDSPFDLTPSEDGSKYFVTKVSGLSDAQVIAWLQTQTPPEADASEVAESTTVEFTGLDLGYYMVKSTLNGGGVITLTNTNPDATVKDKNEIPSDFDKTITQIDGEDVQSGNNSAQIGDTITFELSFKATNYGVDGKKVTDYVLTDDMPDGMTRTGEIVVKVGDKTLTPSEYYLFDGDPDADDFKIVIPWVTNLTNRVGPITKDFTTGLGNLTEEQRKALYLEQSLYESPVDVTITYQATLVEGADIDNQGNANKATWDYDGVSADGDVKDPDEKHETETVYTYALAIMKVNVDGNPLAGAEFTLTDSKGNELKVKEDTEKGEGYYIVDENGTAVLTSPANGVIVIQGLSDETYTLTETKAPEGYNKLEAPVEVEATLLGSTTTNKDIYLDEDGNVVDEQTDTTTKVEVTLDKVAATAVAVVNRSGAELPSTGGIGTTIFYIGGGVLVVAAVVLLITKRRASVDDE